ncbi:branched-chain amino acid aminotransferase [Kitasatospora griseola]|uniref:Branched-chain-amino-acid aminotransferase n=1 Tax=Kitasatospora griseola TaxID=2064 RepID=A0A0D0NT18_KITGR|nr:branched-chain amino acid transaminase [Kitasatospora griseola]KIQ62236.1 branched-chain amino acid aminotransferase [Kitasatospora griseola]
MAIPESSVIWFDGALVPWHEARVHVLSHALHYGTGVLEGTRVFATADGPAVFRLPEHLARLDRSARMLRMELPYSAEELAAATVALVAANGHRECYLRHLAFLGYGSMGLDMRHSPTSVSIASWEWPAYLPEGRGLRLMTSSWRRTDPNSVPPAAKATGPYLNSALARREATDSGFDEALLLAPDGTVSECSSENVFTVRDGVLRTTPASAGALEGITQDTLLTLARDLGAEVRIEPLLRSDLYAADEVFISGTAAGVVPVGSLDNRELPSHEGELTKQLAQAYRAAVHGEDARYRHWLTPVHRSPAHSS